jgi:hypothetical protein
MAFAVLAADGILGAGEMEQNIQLSAIAFRACCRGTQIVCLTAQGANAMCAA